MPFEPGSYNAVFLSHLNRYSRSFYVPVMIAVRSLSGNVGRPWYMPLEWTVWEAILSEVGFEEKDNYYRIGGDV